MNTSSDESISLPATIWAKIFSDCLTFDDLVRCSAVCRSFLHGASPLVSRVFVTKASQLNAALAGRYRAVREAYVYCLVLEVSPPDGASHSYVMRCRGGTRFNDDASSRVVPFLTSFPALETAFVGGLHPERRAWTVPECVRVDRIYRPDDIVHTDEVITYEKMYRHRTLFRNMVRDFCNAFREGRLRPDLHLLGVVDSNQPLSQLMCDRGEAGRRPFSFDPSNFEPSVVDNGGSCELCKSVCRHFPLHLVVMAGRQVYHPGGLYTGTLCLPEKDRFAIVASRQDGADLLCSAKILKAYLAKHHNLQAGGIQIPGEGYTPDPVLYEKGVYSTIEALREHGANPAALGRDDVIGAICQEEDIPIDKREIASESFDALVSLGFNLQEKDWKIIKSEDGVIFY